MRILSVPLSLLLAMNLLAQDSLVPPVRAFRVPQRIGVIGEARLTLEQALAMALANNNDIDASKIDRDIAGYNLAASYGVWDPVMSATNAFIKQVTPIASSLGGSTTGSVLNRNWQTDPAISGSTPWFGGSYRADFNNQRTYTNNSFVTLNPQFPSSLTFQYTQPLMRGLKFDANRRGIEVAQKNKALSEAQFRQRVMQVVQQTEQAYWELAFAYNNLQVQLEAVDIARQQDESNRRQQQQGLLAVIDVVAAQTQLANFEQSAYGGQTALTRAENTLKTLILAERSNQLWGTAIVPTTPMEEPPLLTPLADAIAEGLANRPERTQVSLSAEINKKDMELFREQTKPQVDLVASYSRAGLAGIEPAQAAVSPFTSGFAPLVGRLNQLSTAAGLSPIDFSFGGGSSTPPLLVGSYGQSLNNLWGGNFPATQVQLRVSLPIRNRTAEANLGRVMADRRRIQNQSDQLEQTIEADVRNSMQGVQSTQSRLDAARLQRRSAEEQYNSEQRQFRAGTSTLFLVQQRQNTMIAARSQERRAESDLGQAIALYEMATGTILKTHNINLQ